MFLPSWCYMNVPLPLSFLSKRGVEQDKVLSVKWNQQEHLWHPELVCLSVFLGVGELIECQGERLSLSQTVMHRVKVPLCIYLYYGATLAWWLTSEIEWFFRPRREFSRDDESSDAATWLKSVLEEEERKLFCLFHYQVKELNKLQRLRKENFIYVKALKV